MHMNYIYVNIKSGWVCIYLYIGSIPRPVTLENEGLQGSPSKDIIMDTCINPSPWIPSSPWHWPFPEAMLQNPHNAAATSTRRSVPPPHGAGPRPTHRAWLGVHLAEAKDPSFTHFGASSFGGQQWSLLVSWTGKQKQTYIYIYMEKNIYYISMCIYIYSIYTIYQTLIYFVYSSMCR